MCLEQVILSIRHKWLQRMASKNIYSHIKNKLIRRFIFYLSGLGICLVLINNLMQEVSLVSQKNKCRNSSHLNLSLGKSKTIEGKIQAEDSECFYFNASSQQVLNLDTNIRVRIISPKNNTILTQGIFKDAMKDNGEYLIYIDGNQVSRNFKIKIALSDSEKSVSGSSQPMKIQSNQLTYNSISEPDLPYSPKLASIISSAIFLVKESGLPVDKISISLIDLSNNSRGEYQENIPRFPASITKLFWLVTLLSYSDAGKIHQGSISEEELYKMIQDSDNSIASRVVDQLTNTSSGTELQSTDLEEWIDKRKSINSFFESAGYKNINISQKNFPIKDLNLDKPSGRDKQMRGNIAAPSRNFVTTHSVARLLLDIENGKSISESHSKYIKSLMKRDFFQEKTKQYDSIQGFLGEGLDSSNVQLFSKPGWTGDSRQDAAIIYSHDGKRRYLLVVMGDDQKFAQDWKIFPRISQLIYNQINN